MTSTNALTKRLCESRGWPCATLQTFYGGRRHDLFGLWDSLVLHPDGLLFVQNASYGSLKAHRDEMDKNPHLAAFDRQGVSGAIWEWRKKRVGRKKPWFVREQLRFRARWTAVTDWKGPLDL